MRGRIWVNVGDPATNRFFPPNLDRLLCMLCTSRVEGTRAIAIATSLARALRLTPLECASDGVHELASSAFVGLGANLARQMGTLEILELFEQTLSFSLRSTSIACDRAATCREDQTEEDTDRSDARRNDARGTRRRNVAQ